MPCVPSRHDKAGTSSCEKHVRAQKLVSSQWSYGWLSPPCMCRNPPCWVRQLPTTAENAKRPSLCLHDFKPRLPEFRSCTVPDCVFGQVRIELREPQLINKSCKASSGLYSLEPFRLVCVCVCASVSVCSHVSEKLDNAWQCRKRIQETLIWQGAYHQFLILLTLSSTPSSPNRRRPRYLSLLKTLKVAAMIGCATTGGK